MFNGPLKHHLFNYSKLLCSLTEVNLMVNLKDMGKFGCYSSIKPFAKFSYKAGSKTFWKSLNVTDKHFSQDYY